MLRGSWQELSLQSSIFKYTAFFDATILKCHMRKTVFFLSKMSPVNIEIYTLFQY